MICAAQKINRSQRGEQRYENDPQIATDASWLRNSRGSFLGMPSHALTASCGRPPYASGPHAIAVAAHASVAIGRSSDLTPASNDGDHFHQNSIVGLWHSVYTSGGVTACESFEQWHAAGNEFEASDTQLGAMCQGTWEKTAPRRVRLFHAGWNFDSTGVALTGHFTITQADTLSADGETYDGTFLLQNFDLPGKSPAGIGSERHRPCDMIDRAVRGLTG